MAYDGTTVKALTDEFRKQLLNARIYKIAQPENDELILTLKPERGQKRLLISASASLPVIHFTEKNKPSPLTAPNFCMLLRKHIQNGRIVDISQPGLERCIHFRIQHLDELGDVKIKVLIVELMGKHSNIIFCDDKGMIIDSIKHISSAVSSVREVLPGREYFLPDTMEKKDPLMFTDREDRKKQEMFTLALQAKSMELGKAVYSTFTGFSPVLGQELCYRAGLDSRLSTTDLDSDSGMHFYRTFCELLEEVTEGTGTPCLYLKDGVPVEYSCVELTIYRSLEQISYDSISDLIESYYAKKEQISRIRQKSADLRHIVQTAVERCRRKLDLQLKQLKDTGKREKYKVYGELINTYGYGVPEGAESMEALNYYTNEMITIPLDPAQTPLENAQKYYDRYNKLKRTYEALTSQTRESAMELSYLESVSTSLELAETESDLSEIREELKSSGYIRFRSGDKKSTGKGKPLHYVSCDGYDMYVGKNNMQNEYITHKLAGNSDWWFHSKKYPGSHVIVKARGEELPDSTYEEAARLAAHYSKGNLDKECLSSDGKVEIDYIQKKHIKKTPGTPLGYVIYYTNYSMVAATDISNIRKIDE